MERTLSIKNKKTEQCEVIKQKDLEFLDWGFRFFVESEIEAYKAAYQYRNSLHGCEVKYSKNLDTWYVTVFNERGVRVAPGSAR